MGSEVWGIDIGRSAVKAVKMRRNKDQVEVVGIELIEYEVPADENVDKEEQVRQALQEFKSRVKLKPTEKIYVSIPGQATFNRMITLPPVEFRRIREIVTFEAQQQIPFPIEEVLWDFQLIGKGAEKAVEEREVMLFAVRKEIINNFLANLAAVEITVDGIQIAPLALYNFVRYDRPELESTVVIDIGAENTDLVILHGDKLWLRALPSAGNDITKELQKKFNIPYPEAEKLKLKSGKTKQANKIFEVIKPVLKDIVGEINRSVGYYKSMFKDVKFDKMLFLGNTTKLTGFDQFFSQNLQYAIEIFSEVKRIRVSPTIDVNRFQTNIAGLGVALGLAVQGLDLATNNIRLLPQEIRDRKAMEQQKPILAIAVGLLAIVPISLYIKNSSLIQNLQRSQKDIAPVIQSIQKYEERLTEASDYGSVQKKLEKLSQVGNFRYIWLDILNSVHKTYQQAQEKINKEAEQKSEKPQKMWILDLDIEEKEETIEKGTVEKPMPVKRKYAEVKFKIAFQGNRDAKNLQDSIRNHEYVTNYLKEPLESYLNTAQKHLYDKTRTKPISIEIKPSVADDMVANPKEGEYYCHATLQLVAVME